MVTTQVDERGMTALRIWADSWDGDLDNWMQRVSVADMRHGLDALPALLDELAAARAKLLVYEGTTVTYGSRVERGADAIDETQQP